MKKQLPGLLAHAEALASPATKGKGHEACMHSFNILSNPQGTATGFPTWQCVICGKIVLAS